MKAGVPHRLNRVRSKLHSSCNPEYSSDVPLRSSISLCRLCLQCLFCVASLVLGFRLTREARLLDFQHLEGPSSYFNQTVPSFQFSGIDGTTSYSALQFDGKPANRTDLAKFSGLVFHGTKVSSLPHPDARLPDFTQSVLETPSGVRSSRVDVGRHAILIRPWPHPDPIEVMMAHGLIARVQLEQRYLYGIKDWKPIIAITPTFARTFQAVHLTGLMHTLSLVPGPVTWIVIEAGGVTSETTSLLAEARVHTLVHLGFAKHMPPTLEERGQLEAHMRVEGLRCVRERKLEGIVLFADESNVHSLQLFDKVQNIKWVGVLSVGMLGYAGYEEPGQVTDDLRQSKGAGAGGRNLLAALQRRGTPSLEPQVQGPSCNAMGHFAGWHTFDPLPLGDGRAKTETDVPRKGRLEWAGFVLNARSVWETGSGQPDWVKSWDDWRNLEEGNIPEVRAIVRDENLLETVGDCGREVLLWWVRMEGRTDSKYPLKWAVDPQLDIVVPAKSTPWPALPIQQPSPPPPHPTPIVEGGALVQPDKHREGNKVASRDPKPKRTRRKRQSTRGKVTEDMRDSTVTKGLQSRQ